MRVFVWLAGSAIWLYSMLILVGVVFTWMPRRDGLRLCRVRRFIYDVTEPYLALFRRVLSPVRVGNVALDLSPVAGLVVLYVVGQALVLLL